MSGNHCRSEVLGGVMTATADNTMTQDTTDDGPDRQPETAAGGRLEDDPPGSPVSDDALEIRAHETVGSVAGGMRPESTIGRADR
ncbi:hypothetical protein [Natrinema gari]|uniref:hypothetical protein n=1 Tax=Natrinema gari TaxID=419186 RepID=UPI001267D7F2|nr:hypothetical protein [Natrinema gari]